MTTIHRLLIAPEIIALELADAALLALDRALRVEHPLVDTPPPTDLPPVRRRARTVLRRAARLRVALRRYRGLVHVILSESEHDDLPF
jgi:hypothetical protein